MGGENIVSHLDQTVRTIKSGEQLSLFCLENLGASTAQEGDAFRLLVNYLVGRSICDLNPGKAFRSATVNGPSHPDTADVFYFLCTRCNRRCTRRVRDIGPQLVSECGPCLRKERQAEEENRASLFAQAQAGGHAGRLDRGGAVASTVLQTPQLQQTGLLASGDLVQAGSVRTLLEVSEFPVDQLVSREGSGRPAAPGTLNGGGAGGGEGAASSGPAALRPSDRGEAGEDSMYSYTPHTDVGHGGNEGIAMARMEGLRHYLTGPTFRKQCCVCSSVSYGGGVSGGDRPRSCAGCTAMGEFRLFHQQCAASMGHHLWRQ
jgi:hypothetical protein